MGSGMSRNGFSDGRSAAVVAAFVLSLGSVPGCESPRASGPVRAPEQVVQSAARFRKEYVLAPGDAIEVVLVRTPNLTRVCAIRPDGYISLPMVGEVKAAGMTIPDLGKDLEKRYAARLVDPEVTVVAQAVRQPVVFVLGEVGAPTPVALRDAPTAAQALARVGGFKHTADRRRIAIIRLEDDGVIRARVIEPPVTGQPAAYMALAAETLQADDIIFVPENDIAQFGRYVDDLVNKPLSGINSAFTPYFQIKTIQLLEDE
jgi:polysaccharide export outer membrane protein